MELKFLLVAATFALPSAATLSKAEAAAHCGDLGVMADYLATIDATEEQIANARHCIDHPLGRDRDSEEESVAPMDKEERWISTPPPNLLVERKCSNSNAYGCSKNYCWKACGGNPGDGRWCWTADQGGVGAWRGCQTYNDCGVGDEHYGCGQGCSKKNVCGCSC